MSLKKNSQGSRFVPSSPDQPLLRGMQERQSSPTVTHSQELILQRMLYTIRQYNAEHGAIPMQILSAKYSRLCMAIGGFPEIMMGLEASKQVLITVTKSGRQMVSVPKP